MSWAGLTERIDVHTESAPSAHQQDENHDEAGDERQATEDAHGLRYCNRDTKGLRTV